MNKFGYCFDLLRFTRLHRKYRRFTMIPAKAYVENLALISDVLKQPQLRSGAIVECGTWKGGMSAAMIEVGGTDRKYYFFDSFEGLPPAQDKDGTFAKTWESEKPEHKLIASIDEFRRTIALTGISDQRVEIQKGFFDRTFPNFSPPDIAVLRLDADWYASTMSCLDKFWDHLLPSALVLIDDYHYWDGCTRAVHDFLSKRQIPARIRQGPFGRVAYIIK